MTFGIGNYGGMGAGMGTYGMSSSGGSGNMQQYFKSKYGCEDCFRTQPYPFEYPKPICPIGKEERGTSFWSKLLTKIVG